MYSVGFGLDQQDIDSLKHELAVARNDTSRVLILLSLCDAFTILILQSAMANKALNLLKKANF